MNTIAASGKMRRTWTDSQSSFVLWCSSPWTMYRLISFSSEHLYLMVLFILLFRTVSPEKTFSTAFMRIYEFPLVLSINVHFIKITRKWVMGSSPHQVSFFHPDLPFPLFPFPCSLSLPLLSYGAMSITLFIYWKLRVRKVTIRGNLTVF